MSLQDILEPNLQRYTAQLNGRYVCTRLVTHNGVTIAIALGKTQSNSFFFDYSILDLQDGATTSNGQSTTAAADTDKLDSQCWSSNAKRLQFSSEVRAVGEEAIPVYQIPAVDRSYRKVIRSQSQKQKLDQWLSSSLCLMNQKVFDFQVLSDGRYIYVFRQSASAEVEWPNQFMSESHDGKPPVDNNLLCDRFALVGSTLSQPLETRYQRSRQKQIPLNEQDTLRVKDINDEPFYEPTHSLRFVQDLVDGRFCVLRAPTVTNNVTKWMIFAYSCKMGQIECLTTDLASNGLFDLHGHVYYTCDSDTHPTAKVFTNGPGPCTAAKDDGSGTCSKARVPIMPKTPASKRAVELSGDAGLQLRKPIDLTSLLDGFTLEAWVKPESADNGTEETTKDPSFSVFRVSDNSPGTFINDELRLTIQLVGEKKAIVTSETALKADEWNHIAVTYSPTTSTYGVAINGAAAGSATSSNPPGSFLGIGLQPKGPTSYFTGLFEEVRVWSRPLHPSAIKDRMCKRATGLEPDLESCWHFDEDSGTTAFDATVNHRELMVVSPEDGTPSSDTWVRSAAPMVSSYGLSRRILRLSAPLQIKGGLCATVYNEQVAVSEKKTTDSEGGSSSKQKSGDGAQPKHMKRGARVLICFISGTDASPLRLAALDFGLLSDGTLADTPALMNPPALTAASFNSASAKVGTVGLNVPTALLYVGGEGMEIFGGVVALDAVGCEPSAPYAFESATGTVTVYFKARGASGEGHFSALNYNISRKAVATELCASTLGENKGLLATSKLRHAKNVVVQTDLCPWAPENLAFNLKLTANMVDGKKIVETWGGVPSKLEELCSLINGTKLATTRTIGHVAQLVEITTNGYADMETPPTEIALLDILTDSITAGTFLSIGMRSYFVLKDAQAGDKTLVAVLYNDQRSKGSPPGEGAEVTAKGYQHELLVTCEGKSAGNFSLGSGIVSMAWSPSAVISGAVAKASEANIQVPGTSFISGSSQGPYFGSPPRSTALRLDGRTKCYSMLEDTVATSASPGISFETWIKVEPESINTIAVAYTSERLPRAEGLDKEQQTFVLGITKPSRGGDTFDMIGNVNGTRFAVSLPSTLRFGQWTHFACSSQSAFALMCSGKDYVDLGTSEEWNVSDFSLAFTLKLNKRPDGDNGEHCILVKGDSNADSTPLNVKVSSSNRLQLSYWAMGVDGTNAQRRVFESPQAFDTGKAYKVFLSRKLVQVSQKETMQNGQPPRSKPPRPCQQVTMRAWDSKGEVEFEMIPRSVQDLENDDIAFKSQVGVAGPSVAEYGDMEISASGTLEGSYKRAYAYIDEHGEWCLVTGFRIGALKTEWVSQVRTSPTLIGFIEGAPPVPADSFINKDKAPTSSVKFKQSTKCTYSYSARAEASTGEAVSSKVGGGIGWEVMTGMGVETKIGEGSIVDSGTVAVDVSAGMVNNEVHASTTNVNMEMGVQLTSIWKDGDDAKKQVGFKPSNTGLALIESEVADVFALRLQMRGSIAPVVAYQMRPNPDIPKDRNLVSFEINPTYIKQGCLDGRRGINNDPDYPAVSSAPKDASYYKPTEAYALRERIRRAEEQLQGEYDRQSLLYTDGLPEHGGTFQQTNSTLDMVKSEVGGNLDTTTSLGDSVEEDVQVLGIKENCSVDSLFSAHLNFVMTKDKSSEEGFELATELPPSVDIRYQDKNTGKYFKTPGAVDAYRWMSFWLEPSVEVTDTFFEHVLNHVWLEESPEPNAQLLRTLREGLRNETGNARTKAWRVLHRCTYVSRIPEKIESRPRDAMSTKEQKPSTLLDDIGSNWLLIQKLEPFARDAKSRGNLATTLKPHVLRFFPTLIAQTRLYNQVLDMLADYVGLS
ncbi:hypothetical protein K4K60_006862 [Colletotrichum sp. SAR11_57]|nr:hypothetical protein K4K60_006862 [Colletotrichum sp. SAR11_57]